MRSEGRLTGRGTVHGEANLRCLDYESPTEFQDCAAADAVVHGGDGGDGGDKM